MTQVPPDHPAASAPERSRLAVREVATWVAGIALTVAFAALLGLAGLALGVFGLPGVVLLGVAALLALAAWPWRRAALPLSVVGLALATGGVLSTLATARVARDGGLLSVKPAAAEELQGAELRRGLGSVVVDLRHSRFRPGQHLRLSARSDVGRVAVVLPMNRCFDVDLEATPLDVDGGLAGALVTSAASALDLAVIDERWADINYPELDPFTADMVDVPADVSDLTPIGLAGASLFGRDLVRPWTGTTAWEPMFASRRTGRADAIKLDLRLAAAGAISVTSLPESVGPLARDANRYDQVSDASWPRQTQLPLSPEQQDWEGRWRQSWAKRPDQLRRWRSWERRVVGAAWGKARQMAGPCASRADLRDQWVAARYALIPGNGDGQRRILSVNGLGEVAVAGSPGTRLASRSARDIVRGSGLRLLTPAEMRERRRTYLIALAEKTR